MGNIISLILLSWNGKQYLDSCINSILKQTATPLEIIIVDNGSKDGCVEDIEVKYPSVKLILNGENLGVAAAWNIGTRIAKGSILGFLNQDVEIRVDWIKQIEEAISHDSRKAVIGSKLIYPDSEDIQHAGGVIHYPLALTSHRGKGGRDTGLYDYIEEVDYVTGAAFAVSRDLFEAVGGFDERFYPAYFEDVDFCVRSKMLGYHVIYYPKAIAIHHESTSLGRKSVAFFKSYHLGRLRFVFKHMGKDNDESFDGFIEQEMNRFTLNMLHPNEYEALKWLYGHSELFLSDDVRSLEIRRIFLSRTQVII